MGTGELSHRAAQSQPGRVSAALWPRLQRARDVFASALEPRVTRLGRLSLRVMREVAAIHDDPRFRLLHSVLLSGRNLLTALRLLPPPKTNEVEEVDHVGLVLSDFENLSENHQTEVARNLALLWDSFVDSFGGVSAFQAASPIAQQAYLTKLETVARRMQAARGTPVAYHYVSVELIRQYISFLQLGEGDAKAILLARNVAPLIDRGRRMNSQALAA